MTTTNIVSALLDFRRARRQAELETLLARVTKKSVDLLCYDDVREKLDATQSPRRELRDIELDRIVGSVGRCTDFTRSFLPRQESDARRWARAEIKMSELGGLPPIEVYEVGGVYFVEEGHHRVSVARQSGATHLQAYVTKVKTRVSLPADADIEDVIVQAEYNAFLSKTQLDELRPGSDVSVSVAGHYRKLLEHIDVHRYFMGLDEEMAVEYQEAVADWYDHVYLPVVEVIRALGIMQDFPGRTEADLYLWVVEHRHELREDLGWEVDMAAAAEDLAKRFGEEGQPFLTRVAAALRQAVTSQELRSGPPTETRRAGKVSNGTEERLFRDVLVAIDGEASGWRALDQARLLFQVEDIRAHGLHVLPPGADEEDAQAVGDAFAERLERTRLSAGLTVRSGQVADEIADLARWTDLVVLGLNHPPGDGPMAKIGSDIRRVISRSPRPILFVPGEPTPLDNVVLAYDGSPKAEEALFVATYMAGQWGADATVVTAQELGGPQPGTLKRACRYLEQHGVEATAIAGRGSPARAIMGAVESADANLILLGGYGSGPVLELVLGSTVDKVLRESTVPVLICR